MGHLQERLEDAESTARRDRVVEKRKIDKYEDEVQYLRGELALLYRQNAELLTITAARRVPQSLTNSEVKANDLLEHEEDITAAYCLSSLGNNPGSERPAVYAWDHPRTPREQPESKSSNLPISLSSSDDLSLEPRPAFSSPSPSPSTRHLGASNVMQEDLDPEEAEADDEWGPLIHQLADLRQENETLRSRVDELEAIHDTLEQPFLDERDHAPFCRRNSSSYSSTESCVSSHLDLEFPSSTHLQTMRHQQDSQFSEPSPVDHVHLKCSMASATQSSPYVPSRPSRLSRVFDLGQSERACETDGPFNFAEESIETSAFGRSLASELGDDVSNDGSLRRLAVPSSSSAHLHLPIDWPQQGLSLSEQTFSIQSSQKDVSSASSVPSSATAVELPPSSYRPLSLQSLLGRHPGDAVGSFMPVGMPSIRSSTNVKKVQNRYLQLQSMMALVAVSAIEWSHFILLLIVAAFCCIKQGPAMLQQRQPRHEKTADSALCCS